MSYLLFMVLAFVAAWITSKLMPKPFPLPPSQRLFVGLIGFSTAAIAAKLPFLILGDEILQHSGTIFSSGKTILLGLVGGYAGVELAKWRLGIRTKTGDHFAVPVAVGIGVGRFGCFFGGCCYGQVTDLPWGVVFPTVDALARHPTQVYESIFHFGMAAVLYVLFLAGKFRGQLFKIYLLSYFVFRFLTEFIRPEVRWLHGLTAYQWAIIFLAPIFVFLFWQDQTSVARYNDEGRMEQGLQKSND